MEFELCDPLTTKIGWVGTGVMGESMCGHLLSAGYSATIFNRTKEKAARLLDAGAIWADSPREVAENSDVVFSIVGYPHDVRSVILGDNGALSGCAPGNIIVDMTTSEPSLAIEIAKQANELKVGAIDAPVSGGDIGAKSATLSIMIGGQQSAVDAIGPTLQVLGKTIVHQGEAGAGQHTKMVNQTLIATGMIGVCEALLYGHKAGLNLTTVLKSVGSGAAGSWSLTNLGPRIIDNNFDPGFFVEHFIKDMGIVLSEAKKLRLALPGLALASQLYQSLESIGHGKSGTHALELALAKMSGVDWVDRD